MTLLHNLILSKIFGGSGGGGSSISGMERFPVTFTLSGSTIVADKTLTQITDAKNAGKYVEGIYDGQYCPLVALRADSALFQMIVAGGSVSLNQMLVLGSGIDVDVVTLASADIIENVPESAASITPVENHIYKCGTLTSLTIDSPPASGAWSIRFTSGSTATVLTMPSSVKMPDGFEVEANTVYEINVLDGYALCAGWPVS